MIVAYLLLMNAAAFILMLADKKKAIKKKWRVPESTLMMTAVLGGSLGAIAGMYIFRHKTRHPKFTLGLPIILAVHILLAVILL